MVAFRLPKLLTNYKRGMAAKIVISSDALKHIQEIGDYIETEEGSSDRSLQVVQALYARCKSLSELPNRGAPYKTDYRRIFEGRYQIIYRVSGYGLDRVVLILVVHDMRRVEPTV